jgi:hypothetical protein
MLYNFPKKFQRFDLQKTAFPLLSHPSSNLWLGMRAELNIIIAFCGPFGKRD